jgi:hypothetical protein
MGGEEEGRWEGESEVVEDPPPGGKDRILIKEGLKTPTAVEPAGDTIWIAERGTGKAVSIPMPK